MKRIAFIFALIAAVLLCPLGALAGSVPDCVLEARDGLVRIFCETGESVSCGTGFAVGDGSPVRYIVTNHHVAANGTVTVLCADSLTVEASVFIGNENADLCVLKLKTPLYDLSPLTLDDSGTAHAGDAIYALGFPAAPDVISDDVDGDAEDVTVTDGIISAVKTGKLTDNGASVPLTQINASLSRGNSGGPLLNDMGQVVGVNTLTIPDAQNINMAVSTEVLIRLLDAGGVAYKTASAESARQTTSWILATAAVAALLAVGLALFLRRLKTPRQSFDAFLCDPAKPMADKLRAVAPVVEQVRALHRQGRYHFDICPQNIVLLRGRAVLRVKNVALSAGGMMASRPGYSAPERYSATAPAGPWSDVYAISALLYAVLTGRAPKAAFERGALEEIADQHAPLSDVIIRGLTAEPSQRPTIEALWVQLQAYLINSDANSIPPAVSKSPAEHIKPVASQSSSHPSPNRAPSPDKPQRGGKKRAAVVWAAALILLLGAALAVTEINYAQAVAHTQAAAYEDAQKSLKGVVSFYKDARQLDVFADAAVRLEHGDYDAAARLFASLGGYRNAPEMVKETAYRHAQFNLDRGRCTEAEVLLNTVGDYRDAHEMRTEIAYRNAQVYMDAAMYLSALEELAPIADYKDAADLATHAKAAVYEKAVDALQAGDTETAAACFKAAAGYEKADTYLVLVDLLTRAENGDAFTRDDYQRLTGFADSFDITTDLTRDGVITHYLMGSWHGEGEQRFSLQSDGTISCNLPGFEGSAYAFRDGTLMITKSDGTEAPAFRFSAMGLDALELYDCANGRTYSLTREP